MQRCDATLDHVLPLSKGGQNVIGNLVVACRECNVRKKDYVLGAVAEEHSHWYSPDATCWLCGKRRSKRLTADLSGAAAR